jgi:phosphonopyruvate decarboxylase/sulfopyruvate decarboxylase subunit beta
VVHANGYICRESFAVKDRIENFYMIGSMGMASAIGLGVALAVPDRPTVVFDGDGNLLMSLGILPMIGGGPIMGRGRPGNLVHVVFDNALYGSTGNQVSPSRTVGLHDLAWAARSSPRPASPIGRKRSGIGSIRASRRARGSESPDRPFAVIV